MPLQWWNESVTVPTGKLGQSLVITSTERAAEYMLYEWPAEEDGEAFHAARQALIDAYEGRISADDARRAFVAAAKEAGIFVSETKR